ncbi:MAG: hypothetical protein MH825_06080 [Cyanobacteria bacterium]|nr:hypothetical protein [Cyanobacteriota bacterium]
MARERDRAAEGVYGSPLRIVTVQRNAGATGKTATPHRPGPLRVPKVSKDSKVS